MIRNLTLKYFPGIRIAIYVVLGTSCLGMILMLFARINLPILGFVPFIFTPTLLEKFILKQHENYPLFPSLLLKLLAICSWIICQGCTLVLICKLVMLDIFSPINGKKDVFFVMFFSAALRALLMFPIYLIAFACWIYVVLAGTLYVKNFDYNLKRRIKHEALLNNY